MNCTKYIATIRIGAYTDMHTLNKELVVIHIMHNITGNSAGVFEETLDKCISIHIAMHGILSYKQYKVGQWQAIIMEEVTT